MKNLLKLISFLLFLVFVSCSSSRDRMAEQIASMESGLKHIQKMDTGAVTELIGAYQNFAAKYPGDSLSPEFLYKAAGLASGFNRGNQAIDLYETLISKYPEYKNNPECYFMEAFKYENVKGDLGKASEYYSKFIEKYPHHPLTDDARAALKFLGKTPADIVRELENSSSDSLKSTAN